MARRVAAEKAATTWEDHMSAFGGHPLHRYTAALRGVEGADAIAAADGGDGLASLGVTDVEQLVALAATDEGRNGLAAALGVSKQQVDSLVKETKKILPPGLAAELEHPLPPMFPLGAVPPPTLSGDGIAELTDMPEAIALASSANLIAKMSPIRNQGARGCCVAFTLTAINEYYRRARGAAQDLSEQHLYHETKLIDGSPSVCGTWQRVASQVLSNRGQCREAIWPYNPNLPCNNNGTMPSNARTDAANYKVTVSALTATSVNSIKSALAARRPVGISIPVYNSWYLSAETKRSGRITMPLSGDTQAGGHAICTVGYQDDASSPGGGFFLVRNHWSTGWGSQCPYGAGYGTIPYQYISGYCWEAYALASAVSLDEPVAPREAETRTLTITVRGNVNLIIE